MKYIRGDRGLDRFGGLPTHLPHNWPRCQTGQERMAFLGQIYSCDWFPIDGLLCLQFYTCIESCVLDVDFLHMECVHVGASKNTGGHGIANPSLAVRTIEYYPTEDSIDHETFLQIISDNNQPWPEPNDKHHYQDRLGGVYTFDGSEAGISITATNRCIGHFQHPCVDRTTIYLWQSEDDSVYAQTYY